MVCTYITHINALIEDTSINCSDRDRLKGYLRKWKQPKVLIGTALYVEVLKPASILSLTLQGDVESTLKTVKSLKTLSFTINSCILGNTELHGF